MTEVEKSAVRQSATTGLFWQALLLTGLLAGTLDAVAAIVNYSLHGGHQPARIFRYIASGVFGKRASNGGPEMVVYGVLFHYAIAFGFTAIFFLLYPRLPFLRRHPLLSGIGYGVGVWLIMNAIVVPLSLTPPLHPTLTSTLTGIFILILAIGLPVSFLARAWLRLS